MEQRLRNFDALTARMTEYEQNAARISGENQMLRRLVSDVRSRNTALNDKVDRVTRIMYALYMGIKTFADKIQSNQLIATATGEGAASSSCDKTELQLSEHSEEKQSTEKSDNASEEKLSSSLETTVKGELQQVSSKDVSADSADAVQSEDTPAYDGLAAIAAIPEEILLQACGFKQSEGRRFLSRLTRNAPSFNDLLERAMADTMDTGSGVAGLGTSQQSAGLFQDMCSIPVASTQGSDAGLNALLTASAALAAATSSRTGGDDLWGDALDPLSRISSFDVAASAVTAPSRPYMSSYSLQMLPPQSVPQSSHHVNIDGNWASSSSPGSTVALERSLAMLGRVDPPQYSFAQQAAYVKPERQSTGGSGGSLVRQVGYDAYGEASAAAAVPAAIKSKRRSATDNVGQRGYGVPKNDQAVESNGSRTSKKKRKQEENSALSAFGDDHVTPLNFNSQAQVQQLYVKQEDHDVAGNDKQKSEPGLSQLIISEDGPLTNRPSQEVRTNVLFI